MKENDKDVVALLAWSVWNDRNAVTHGSLPRHRAEVVAAATSLLAAYVQISDDDRTRYNGGGLGRAEARWCLPAGFIKVNVDNAIFKDVGGGNGCGA